MSSPTEIKQKIRELDAGTAVIARTLRHVYGELDALTQKLLVHQRHVDDTRPGLVTQITELSESLRRLGTDPAEFVSDYEERGIRP